MIERFVQSKMMRVTWHQLKMHGAVWQQLAYFMVLVKLSLFRRN